MIIKYTNKNLKKIIGLIYLITILIVLYYFFSYFDLKDLKNYDFLINLKNKTIDYKNNNYFIFSIIFIFISIFWFLLVGIGIPFAIFAGLVYGKFIGTILFLFIVSISTLLFYSIVEFFFQDLVKRKFLQKYSNIGEMLKKNELIYLILFQLIEGIPFMIASALPVLFNVKKSNIFFASFIGLSPSIFIHVSIGSGLNSLLDKSIDTNNIMYLLTSTEIYLPIAGLIFLTFISLLIRNRFFKK